MPRTSIVIVNYRTAPLVIDCLQSLFREMASLGDCQVVIVENGSGDDSAVRIGQAIAANGWGPWARLLPLSGNVGFAGGNNAALRQLLASPQPPEYFLLLNPDTVVRPGAIQPLVQFLEAHPDVGIVGSRLENLDGTPQRSAFRFFSVASELEGGLQLGLVSRLLERKLIARPVSDEAHETDWIAGASMLVRRQVFEKIGLLDEEFFLYFEEVDFCLRAHKAGWACWYLPSSRVVHLVGQSSGVTSKDRAARRVPRYWFESRKRYFRKHHGWLYSLVADLAWAGGFALWRMRRMLQRKPDRDPPHLLWDFCRFNFFSWA